MLPNLRKKVEIMKRLPSLSFIPWQKQVSKQIRHSRGKLRRDKHRNISRNVHINALCKDKTCSLLIVCWEMIWNVLKEGMFMPLVYGHLPVKCSLYLNSHIVVIIIDAEMICASASVSCLHCIFTIKVKKAYVDPSSNSTGFFCSKSFYLVKECI